MTSASSHQEHAEQMPRGTRKRRPLAAKWTTAVAAFVGLSALFAGCVGSNSPGIAGSGSNKVTTRRHRLTRLAE